MKTRSQEKLKIARFAARLKTLRLEKKLSLEKLADLAYLPLSQIARIENGQGNPTLTTIMALCRAPRYVSQRAI